MTGLTRTEAERLLNLLAKFTEERWLEGADKDKIGELRTLIDVWLDGEW
jgi:hypothetical protein